MNAPRILAIAGVMLENAEHAGSVAVCAQYMAPHICTVTVLSLLVLLIFLLRLSVTARTMRHLF